MCSPSRFSRSSAGYSTAPLKVPRGCLEPLMEEPELYPTWMDSRQSESTIRTLPLSPISMHSDDSQKLSEPISERILPLEDSCGPSQLQLLDDLSPDLKQSNENVHSMHDKESDSSQALKETSNGQKKCTVENCTPSFGRTVELERHLNELHAPKLYYPVISCELHTVDLGFGQKEELTQHLEREHSEDAVAASSHPPMPTKRELNPPKSNTSMFKKLVSTGANPTTQLLYAILSQMSLKDALTGIK
ncbi:hypothetical protein B0O99DRAFT_156822 [Bisporella sp. PMI_857]|nr:hypothetical protein B0O99DRAFT_156822 [Bisporella sp. PMI_857]